LTNPVLLVKEKRSPSPRSSTVVPVTFAVRIAFEVPLHAERTAASEAQVGEGVVAVTVSFGREE
jgi:hypothetical protein